jgi:hypothetical protein
VHIDSSEIVVSRFGVFATGEFLMLGGQGTAIEPRLAIMNSGGGRLLDVPPPSGLGFGVPHASWPGSEKLTLLEPAANGLVYLVSEDGTAYGIASTGEISGAIQLTRPREGAGLSEIKISGDRLAAIYTVHGDKTLWWISVYELSTGKPVAAYGPVENIVMCYRAEAGRDQFTLLRPGGGRIMFATASSP